MAAKSLEEMKAAQAARQPIAVPAPPQNGHQALPPPRQAAHEHELPPEERENLLARPVRRSTGNNQVQDIHRVAPHSTEAEQGIIGSIVIEPKYAIPLALEKIGKDHFYVPAHQMIFTDAIELYTTEGTFDLITFTQYLRDVGHLDLVGGPAFVTSVFTFVPMARNLPYYLDIVVDKFALRQIIAAATEQVRRAYEEQDDVPALLREFAEKAERAVRTAQGGTRLPELDDMSLLVGDNLPPKPPELIKGILHQGSKLIVGGTSKGRKTFALMDLAISVATGAKWWGLDTAQGPVCYLNFEIQNRFFAERKDDICRAKGVKLDPKMFMAWNLRGHGEGIENLIEELLFVLRRRDYVLIIVDPAYKALGNRDENKAGDIASLLNAFERISVLTGAAIGFGAHYSKGNQAGKESIDRIGGSGVFARDPDAILTMTAHEQDNHFTVDPTLRNFPPINPFVVKWDWPLFTRAEDLDPNELKQPRKTNSGAFQSKYSTNDIFDHLSVVNGIKQGDLRQASNTLRAMSKATFYRLAAELQKKGLLIERDGEWFRGTKEDKK